MEYSPAACIRTRTSKLLRHSAQNDPATRGRVRAPRRAWWRRSSSATPGSGRVPARAGLPRTRTGTRVCGVTCRQRRGMRIGWVVRPGSAGGVGRRGRRGARSVRVFGGAAAGLVDCGGYGTDANSVLASMRPSLTRARRRLRIHSWWIPHNCEGLGARGIGRGSVLVAWGRDRHRVRDRIDAAPGRHAASRSSPR
jgi:hypothetical protein